MKNMYEVFKEFSEAKTKEAKITVLHKNNNWALQAILRGTYHPRIKYSVERVPYYKPDIEVPQGLSYSTIAMELRKAYIFEEGNPQVPKGLTDERKNHILIQILENLEAPEAIVFMNMLLKKEQAKGLTYKLVKEAFPSLLP